MSESKQASKTNQAQEMQEPQGTQDVQEAQDAGDLQDLQTSQDQDSQSPQGPPPSRLDKLPTWVFKLMLLAAPIIWGASFVVMKYSLDTMGPATLVGIRFTVAALLVLVFFFPRIRANFKRETVVAGVVLGVVFFIAYWTQNVGLVYTTPGKNAFLTAAYVVIVPFLYWVLSGRSPNIFNLVAALICLIGIGFISLDSALIIDFGDAMTLVCAFFFALHIALLSKYAANYDVFTMSFLQFMVCGILGLIVGAFTEPMPSLEELMNPAIFWQLFYLAVGSSFLASMFQNVGQTRVNPSQASLILSLEGVFGVLISIVFYGEVLTARVALGFVLIFIAIIVSEVISTKEMPWLKKTT